MEQDKSRGLRHIQDKRKYKGNSTKNAKYVPPKSQPNLESNWYRYEKEGIEDENDLTCHTDFAVLAEAPIAKGKHFQTKNDKLLASDTESTTLTGLFNLDLQKLEESLLTIPYYKRVNIEEKYFTENQITVMNVEAQEHLKKLKQCSEFQASKTALKEPSKQSEVSEQLILDASLANAMTELGNCIEDLTLETNTTAETDEKCIDNEDLEKWLDDFLNE